MKDSSISGSSKNLDEDSSSEDSDDESSDYSLEDSYDEDVAKIHQSKS